MRKHYIYVMRAPMYMIVKSMLRRTDGMLPG